MTNASPVPTNLAAPRQILRATPWKGGIGGIPRLQAGPAAGSRSLRERLVSLSASSLAQRFLRLGAVADVTRLSYFLSLPCDGGLGGSPGGCWPLPLDGESPPALLPSLEPDAPPPLPSPFGLSMRPGGPACEWFVSP